MTLKTFFTSIGKDAHFNYEQMLKHQVIDETAGFFNDRRAGYQEDIATPFTRYQSFQAFVGHGKNLAASVIMAIPNLMLGVLSVTYNALIGMTVLAAKLLILPFKILFSGLIPEKENESLAAMGKSLESSIKGIISSLIKWSLGIANALLTTIRDAVLMPLLFTTTLVTKSATTVIASSVDTVIALKDYCTSVESEEPSQTMSPSY